MYLLIFVFFFWLKNLETNETKKESEKPKEEILKKVKAVNNMEKIIKNKKCNVLWIAYQQDQIFEKFKMNDNFIDMVKKFGISKSTILFKISIVKFVNKYPRMKKSSLSLH